MQGGIGGIAKPLALILALAGASAGAADKSNAARAKGPEWAKPAQSVVTSGKVRVFSIPKDEMDRYGYNPGEYWISGTDVVGEFSIEDASKFYSALFDAIRQNFVENAAPGRLVDKVFESLSAFADRLDITVTGDRVMVYDPTLKLVGNFRKPADTDSAAWANLLVNVILNLRENVPEIRRAHPEQIYYITATYLLKSLDENARYIDPASFAREKTKHHSTSLGFDWRRIPAGIQVIGISAGAPMSFSGIAEGDVITHINTMAAAKLSDELVEDALRGNDFGLAHFGYVAYMTRQPGEAYIRRNAVSAPPVSISSPAGAAIPVLVAHNFAKGAARSLKEAIDGLDKSSMRGLIIDARGNMGGEFAEAMECANLLVPGGELLTTKGRGAGAGKKYSAKSGDILGGKPIAVLADMTTRGAAEAFAFALDAAGRAVLIGSPTYGTGTVPARFEFLGDRAAEFAVARAYSPGGASLDRMGALPLVCLATFKMEKDVDTFARNAIAGKFRDDRVKLESPTDAEIDAARKSCPAPYPTIETQARAIKIAEAIISKDGVFENLINM